MKKWLKKHKQILVTVVALLIAAIMMLGPVLMFFQGA